METDDSLLPARSAPQVRRDSQVDTQSHEEDAHSTATRTGNRRNRSPQSVCTSSASRGVLTHEAWSKFAADSGIDVEVGRPASLALRWRSVTGFYRAWINGSNHQFNSIESS